MQIGKKLENVISFNEREKRVGLSTNFYSKMYFYQELGYSALCPKKVRSDI